MRYRRAKIKGGTFFFTVVTHGRKRILCNEPNVLFIKEAFRHVIEQRPFSIDAVVLLPDHVHCIWTLPEDDDDFSIRWRLFKSYFTRRYGDGYKGLQTASMLRKGERAVWQSRFWEHVIRDEDDFKKHADYIHYNPVKHGVVKSPGEWPYSSFHRYVRQGVYDREWGAGDDVVFEPTIGHE